MEAKIKHLEFIQGVINRTANNSFLLKGWTVTLLTILFIFATEKIKEISFSCILIAIFPVFIFWLLDGFFLQKERLFRDLYNEVRTKDENQIDFSLDTKQFEKKQENKYVSAFFSKTIWPFYIPLMVTIVALTLIIKFSK